jgi:hypothetical protein
MASKQAVIIGALSKVGKFILSVTLTCESQDRAVSTSRIQILVPIYRVIREKSGKILGCIYYVILNTKAVLIA